MFSSHRAVKTFLSVMKTSQLKLYYEIIAVCSTINTKHKYTVWAECGIFNVKPGGT
jgi:hypothetical protein